MTPSETEPTTLLGLLSDAPADRTAIILPERTFSVTYGALRTPGRGDGGRPGRAGIGRGDRVATVLPNGLPAIVSFLAASIAGTAAPLNPGYREDEFTFLSGRHRRQGPAVPPEARTPRGAPPASQSRCSRSRWMPTEWSPLPGADRKAPGRPPARTTSPWCCTPAEARDGPSACRSRIATSPHLRAQHRAAPTPHAGGRFAVRDAAVPRPRAGGVHAFDAAIRRHRGGARQVQSAVLLAHGARSRRHLVFGRSHHPQSAALARRGTSRPAAPKGCASSARAARRCRRK